MIEPRLNGDKVALSQYIFPKRVQMRAFLRRETNAVAQVMIKHPRQEFVKMPLGFVEKRMAACPGAGLRMDDLEHTGCRFPRLLLLFGRRAADGERPSVVGMVAAEADAKVQDHELAGLNLAVARSAAAGIR